MRNHLIRHLLILLLASVLVLATPIVFSASGDSDNTDPIEVLEDLIEDISGLPPGTVSTRQTKTLCNKIRAVIHQVGAGTYKGAVNKLGNDVINAIEGWVYDKSARVRLIGKAEYVIDLILGLIRPVHDMAITDFCVTPTEVTMGEAVYANVTIVNEGTEPEAFDIYVYADAIIIETMLNVTLHPETNATLGFTWDTTGVDKGAYTLSAEVPPVEGEKDTEDNFFMGGIVNVSLLLKHDVTVTGVNAPPETTQGTRVTISVDVLNLGDFDETLNLSVTYDATLIETLMLTPLDSGSSVTLVFFWDTRNVEPNTYTITAEAFLDEDENYTNNKASTLITIISGPAPPAASFVFSPADPIVNETVIFDSSESYDPDGYIASYFWDFGDEKNGTGKIVEHVYVEIGIYTITLIVTDNDGLTGMDSVDFTVSMILEPPVASFTYEPIDPLRNQNVSFDASASIPDGGSIVSYMWDFGDGTTGSGIIVKHAYTENGDYTVTLNVTDSEGLWDVKTDIVQVYPRQPRAAFSFVTMTLNTNEIGTWNATASNDPDGEIVWYYWSFGDGSLLNATGPIANHNYSDNGAFTIVLVVGDDDGLTDTVSTSVTVFNRAPVADFTESAESLNTGETVIFDSSESYDPDGYIASYFWDFGDEKNGTGKIVNHTYTTPGNYMVKLTVTDDDGASSSLSATKTVTTPSGLPLAWFAATGLGVTALTATLLYALYRKKKKRSLKVSNLGGFGSLAPVALRISSKVLTGCD